MNVEVAPMRNLDELLSTLASAMSVDVLPGDSDPSNHALPQQSFPLVFSFHAARGSRPSERSRIRTRRRSVTVAFLGHAGQPLASLRQCTLSARSEDALDADDVSMEGGGGATTEHDAREVEDALDCMERCSSAERGTDGARLDLELSDRERGPVCHGDVSRTCFSRATPRRLALVSWK
ncbi:hypothetical protein PINS_up017058, partial [Pythium insidiosum]